MDLTQQLEFMRQQVSEFITIFIIKRRQLQALNMCYSMISKTNFSFILYPSFVCPNTFEMLL